VKDSAINETFVESGTSGNTEADVIKSDTVCVTQTTNQPTRPIDKISNNYVIEIVLVFQDLVS